MKIIRQIVLSLAMLPVLTGTAQDTLIFQSDSVNMEDSLRFLTQDDYITDMLDTLFVNRYLNQDYPEFNSNNLNKYNFSAGFVPVYTDSVYAARIDSLNRETPIELAYNNLVKSYIELYAVKKRDLTSRILGLSYLYFPLFEEYLDKYNMPLELKYLAIVESALNPTAGSRAGAKGLWQFMYGTGKVYGLKVTSFVDDRFDPLAATDAACRHMKDLYDIYGDWSLVLAAYNSGAGNVNKAIRRAGNARSYWAIWPYLPRETRGYVPAFIAVVYVMNYSVEHNLYPVNPGIILTETDTIIIRDVLSFDQIQELAGIPESDLRFLNPQFKLGVIPAGKGKTYPLRIPNAYMSRYLAIEDSVYDYKTQKGIEREKLLADIKKASERTVHVVRKGESLGLIASRYRVGISQLKSWNNLRSNTIYPGQNLVVFPQGAPASYAKTESPDSKPEGKPQTSNSEPMKRSAEKSYHIVKQGENLGLIAERYNCSITDLKEWNNLSSSTIYPNQKLTVYSLEAAEVARAESGTKFVYHTVRKGDTLWDIAKEYDGVTVEQIKRLNNISNTKKLKVGQKLKISPVS